MAGSARIFLDTSALFAGIWSATGGARMILRLGEVGAIRVLVSSRVLAEAEGAFRRKAPEDLKVLALLLDRSKVEVVPDPDPETVQQALLLTGHMGDAWVLAAAWQASVDYFVTLDREHFLDNPNLTGAAPFSFGTPGDFLAWYRQQLGRNA